VAGALPGQQHSPGVLHLNLQIPSIKNKNPSKWTGFIFGGADGI
jgi:hypothetical protein